MSLSVYKTSSNPTMPNMQPFLNPFFAPPQTHPTGESGGRPWRLSRSGPPLWTPSPHPTCRTERGPLPSTQVPLSRLHRWNPQTEPTHVYASCGCKCVMVVTYVPVELPTDRFTPIHTFIAARYDTSTSDMPYPILRYSYMGRYVMHFQVFPDTLHDRCLTRYSVACIPFPWGFFLCKSKSTICILGES